MTRVVVNGTFDILHRGHLQLLLFAREQGDYLTVAVDTDERVRRLKGDARPINKLVDRLLMLMHLKTVSNVVSFDTDDELKHLISQHDVMVKGSDYKGKPIIGEDVCKEIIFFDIIDGYSTTKKIQDISSGGCV